MSEESLSYFQRLQKIKLNQLPKEAIAKPKKSLKKVSDKRAIEIANSKVELGEDETLKEKWFKARRKEMVGVCQCGCAMPSSKKDDANFRSSICHIFPQRLFESVQFHRLNWVESFGQPTEHQLATLTWITKAWTCGRTLQIGMI